MHTQSFWGRLRASIALSSLALTLPIILAPARIALAGDAGVGPPHLDAVGIARELAEREYGFSQGASGLQAPNRRQGLRSLPGEDGLTLVPRSADYAADAMPWAWSWVTCGFGREDAVESVAATTAVPHGTRVEYPRASFIEWWDNRPEGIEQGFTIPSRPAGQRRLVIEGEVSGTLHPRLASPDRIEFMDAVGAVVLNYDALVAVDAQGCRLPASLALQGDRIRILISDTDATYPVVIDPLVSASTLAGSQGGAQFGIAVSTAGDVNGDGFSDVFVGAPDWDGGQSDEGKVFLWFGAASGLATDPDWSWEPDQATVRVGASVSTAGDLNGDGYDDIVAGAPSYSAGPLSQGAAYVWAGGAAGPGASPDWVLLGGSLLYELGTGVSDAGDVNGDGYDDLLIGVRGWSSPESWEGAVLLYLGGVSSHLDPTGLGANPTPAGADWRFESNQANVRVAEAISGAGDVNGDGYDDVIIGGGWYDAQNGAAWVFFGGPGDLGPDGRPGNADWNTTAFAGVAFGRTVSGIGDVNGDGYADVAVGTSYYTNGQAEEGWVGVYAGSASGPTLLPLWQHEGNQAGAHFGAALEAGGDVDGDGFADMLVGAPQEDGPSGQPDRGRAYLFEGSANGLATTSSLSSYGLQANSEHGLALASAGDLDGDGFGDVLIGAPFMDVNVSDDGWVLAMRGTPDGLAESPAWTVQSNQPNAKMGITIASAGDVDADGYSDVLVGAPFYDAGEPDEGVVFFYRGGPGVLAGGAAWTAQSNQAGAQLGQGVDGAGDVNGDGYGDVILGAPFYSNTGAHEGAAFVWLGSAAGLGANGTPANADRVLTHDQDDAAFGQGVAGIGDVNGDGYQDVAIGAPGRDGAGENAGAAYVHAGGPGGTAVTASWSARGDGAFQRFGYIVDGAGDVNGDGFSDLAVGAGSYSELFVNEGAVFLWHGSPVGFGPSGIPSNADWSATGGQVEARLGDAVSTAGDVNRDGYSDLIAGAWGWSNGQSDEGQARVWLGGPTGLARAPVWMVESDVASAKLGMVVSDGGDLNGDGYDDVLLGVPNWNGAAGSFEGELRVYPGGSAGPGSVALLRLEGGQPGALFGWSVAGELDINGDGFRDVVAGAPTWTAGQAAEGHAFAFLGNGNGGLDRIPQQRGPSLQPLALLDKSQSETQFRVHARARSASGRTRVRLQWEVKPYGTPFDGTGLSTQLIPAQTQPPDPALGSFIDLGLPATGLDPGTWYHWRVRILAAEPRFPRTPWFTIAGNGGSERDLRTDGDIVVGVPDDTPSETWDDLVARLDPPRPNPCSGPAGIAWALSRPADVDLAIIDVTGRRVTTLAAGHQAAGDHLASWNGRDEKGRRMAGGIYFVRMAIGNRVAVRKLALIR